MDEFIAGYVECLLWLAKFDNGESVSGLHVDDIDIAPTSMEKIRRECADFYNANRETWERGGWRDDQAGHDFYLTRNRHGAGFWDREYNDDSRKVRQELTRNAQAYGETCDTVEIEADCTYFKYVVYSE